VERLRRLLKERHLKAEEAAAVGDGANDIDLLRAVGLGVAYRGKPAVRQATPFRIDHSDLTAVCYFQGLREADLVLHRIDASDTERWQRVRQVNAVLKELGAEKIPQIRVYNKIDRLERRPRVNANRRGEGRAVWLSAKTGEGIPLLLEAIAQRLRRQRVQGMMRLRPDQGRQRARLFELGAVDSETVLDDGGWLLELNLGERDLQRFLKRESLPASQFEPAIGEVRRDAATQR